MNIKKITAIAAAVIMAAGVCAGVPAGSANLADIAVTAQAASDSDLIIGTDTAGHKYVFSCKKSATGDVKIPDDVYWIMNEAFAGNSAITSVTLPKNCYFVGEKAFAECTSLKKVVAQGDINFYNESFSYCISLESVTVKESITGIGSSAFFGCQSLKTVSIEKDEQSCNIGDSAFQNCFSLESINIPSKCKSIGGQAFFNCYGLSKLTVPAKTEIRYDNGVNMGYGSFCKTAQDAEKNWFKELTDKDMFIADGKTSCYGLTYNFKDGKFLPEAKKFTPKKLTLTVTKDSPAEKWAEKNGIDYIYADGKKPETEKKAETDKDTKKTAAPANIKASRTNNSITLSWDKAEGADMYRVYKYNDKTKKYEKYKDVTSAKCTVKGLKANTKYKFKVVSYSKSGGKYVKGESSEPVSVTTKK